jgi:hypothetical protein
VNRPGLTFASAFAVALLALCLVACGDNDNGSKELATALGGKTSDAGTLHDFFDVMGGFPDTQIKILRAFNQEDVVAARKEVDVQTKRVSVGERVVPKIETPKLRGTVRDYMVALDRVTRAEDAVVSFAESGQTDAAKQAQLVARVRETATAAHAADAEFTQKMRANLPPDLVAQVNKTLKEYRARARAAQNASP